MHAISWLCRNLAAPFVGAAWNLILLAAAYAWLCVIMLVSNVIRTVWRFTADREFRRQHHPLPTGDPREHRS